MTASWRLIVGDLLGTRHCPIVAGCGHSATKQLAGLRQLRRELRNCRHYRITIDKLDVASLAVRTSLISAAQATASMSRNLGRLGDSR